MYFNKKNNRVGSLFQGRYCATNIINKEHLLYVSKYIHLNPKEINKNLESAYSSYSDYLGTTNTMWLNKQIILNEFKKSKYMRFNKIKTYKQFVEEWTSDLPQFKFDLI